MQYPATPMYPRNSPLKYKDNPLVGTHCLSCSSVFAFQMRPACWWVLLHTATQNASQFPSSIGPAGSNAATGIPALVGSVGGGEGSACEGDEDGEVVEAPVGGARGSIPGGGRGLAGVWGRERKAISAGGKIRRRRSSAGACISAQRATSSRDKCARAVSPPV